MSLLYLILVLTVFNYFFGIISAAGNQTNFAYYNIIFKHFSFKAKEEVNNRK